MDHKLHPWQKQLIVDIESYSKGKSAGEMTILMSGRNAGKSMFSSAAFKRLWDDIYKAQPVKNLILTEGRVHGSRYYCVEPEGGVWMDMEEWCREVFGEPGEIWPQQDFVWPEIPRWMQNNRKFWFRSEKDRDWFIIRWNA